MANTVCYLAGRNTTLLSETVAWVIHCCPKDCLELELGPPPVPPLGVVPDRVSSLHPDEVT